MADIVWSINPANDSLEKMIIRMKEFAAEILEPKNIAFEFIINGIQTDLISVEKRKNIFLLFKEAINNAAKYSEAKKIVIKFTNTNKIIDLNIIDNGVGFNLELTKKGNGLRNMKARAASCGGTYEITSSKTGTSISLKVSIT